MVKTIELRVDDFQHAQELLTRILLREYKHLRLREVHGGIRPLEERPSQAAHYYCAMGEGLTATLQPGDDQGWTLRCCITGRADGLQFAYHVLEEFRDMADAAHVTAVDIWLADTNAGIALGSSPTWRPLQGMSYDKAWKLISALRTAQNTAQGHLTRAISDAEGSFATWLGLQPGDQAAKFLAHSLLPAITRSA